MRSTPSMESEPSPRFLTHPQTVEMLDLANEALNGLTYDLHALSADQNPKSATQPYESSAFFALDGPTRDRASALAYSPSFGLERDERTDFVRDSILGHSLILSHSSLGDAIKEDGRTSTFRTSRMNPDAQMVWTHPLNVETPGYGDQPLAAVQLTYTLNQDPNWKYPGNDDVEKVWRAHEPGLARAAKALSALALHTDSLSRSLEMEPPVSPNAYVIHWDMRNSTSGALSHEYATLAAYLDTWKRARARVTSAYETEVLDGGDGEFIIIPFDKKIDIHSSSAVRTFGKSHVQPLVESLLLEQERIAAAYAPDIFPKLRFGVGVGYVEIDDGNHVPTGQVIWDLARTTNANAFSALSYTRDAATALGIEKP